MKKQVTSITVLCSRSAKIRSLPTIGPPHHNTYAVAITQAIH
jgi:hypothetical protein